MHKFLLLTVKAKTSISNFHVIFQNNTFFRWSINWSKVIAMTCVEPYKMYMQLQILTVSTENRICSTDF